MKQTLLKSGEFTSHSGLKLPFKINCDALSDKDIECIAEYMVSKTDFCEVKGIPTGGCRLAEALNKHSMRKTSSNHLIVDDVLTTGTSMEEHKTRLCEIDMVHPDNVVGWVIFTRIKPPTWINAMFELYNDKC